MSLRRCEKKSRRRLKYSRGASPQDFKVQDFRDAPTPTMPLRPPSQRPTMRPLPPKLPTHETSPARALSVFTVRSVQAAHRDPLGRTSVLRKTRMSLVVSAMVVGTSYSAGSIATCSSGVLSVEPGTMSLSIRYQRSCIVATSVLGWPSCQGLLLK